MVSEWQEIPGYEGRYEASRMGKIRRIYKKAEPKELSAYIKINKSGSKYYCVNLTDGNGKSKQTKVATLVYETFVGRVPKNHSLYHKDGVARNNELSNLELLTKEELGRKTGHISRHKPVLKCDSATLIPIEAYRSARAAAKANFMSYQTVLDRCNGKTKGDIAPDGFVYVWDADELYA